MKILLAVDGSDCSVKAARFLATHFDWFRGPPELHMIHVKVPIPKGLAIGVAEDFLDEDKLSAYYREQAEAALAPAEKTLRELNIPFRSIYKVGDIPKEIHAYASSENFDMIVIGSHGQSALRSLVMGSVATRLLATTTDMPVLIVR